MIRKGAPPRTISSPMQVPQRTPVRPNDYYENPQANGNPIRSQESLSYSRGSPASRGNGYESPRFVGRSSTDVRPNAYSRQARNEPTPQLRYMDERGGGGPRPLAGGRPERPERRYPMRQPTDDSYGSTGRPVPAVVGGGSMDDNSGSGSNGSGSRMPKYDLDRSRSEYKEYSRERSNSSRRNERERGGSRSERGERYDRERGGVPGEREREREREPRPMYGRGGSSDDIARGETRSGRPRVDRDMRDYKSPILSSSTLTSNSSSLRSKSQDPGDRYRVRTPRMAPEPRGRQDSESSISSSRSHGNSNEDIKSRSTAASSLSDLFGQIENEIDATLNETSSSSATTAKYNNSTGSGSSAYRGKESRPKEDRYKEEREVKVREREEREKREKDEREKREREKRDKREREEREEREEKDRERERERLRNMRNDDFPRPQRVGGGEATPTPRILRNQSMDKQPSRPPRQESCDAVLNNPPRSPRNVFQTSPSQKQIGHAPSINRSSSTAARNVGPHRGRIPPPIPVAAMPSDIADVTENDQDVDTLTISSKYRDHFIDHLISQEYTDPTPDDFITSEGYYMWEDKTDKRPFPDVLAQLVDHRFSKEWIDEQERKLQEKKKAAQPNIPLRPGDSSVEVLMVIKVVQAVGLIAKEGKKRNPYCEMYFDGSTFHTEKCDNTLEPYWNQHLEIKAKNLTENIILRVWDKKAKGKFWKKDDNDECLGQVSISVGELITKSAKSGYISQWYPLGKRPDKKDKYVGGRILLEAGMGKTTEASEKSMSNHQQQQLSDYELLQSQLVSCKVSFKKLYNTLLKACLEHDLTYMRPDITANSLTSEILSDEAKILLKVFGKKWVLGDAFQVISYLEQVFTMHVNNKLPIPVVVATFDVLHDSMKKEGWLPAYERPHLIDLLDQMNAFHSKQVCHYREYFPKAQPEGALQNAILLWRMIFKNRIFREQHHELPESFREEIRRKIQEHVENRYTKLLGLSSPFVETTEDILNGLAKLADLIVEDIEDDLKYYHIIFSQEVNIVRISAETYLKYFVQELENNNERLSSPEAVKASKSTFELYKRVRLMDQQYARLVPGLKRLSKGSGFDVERWFKKFVTLWLEEQQEKTMSWVKNAIDSDKLEKTSDEIPHSSSVVDLFEIMFEELELIKGLEWSDNDQYTSFLTSFAKIVTKAIEQYCDSMQSGEIKKEEAKVNPLFAGAAAAFGYETDTHQPTDIANESCVKLCNIEEALIKLDEMYKSITDQNIKKIPKPKLTNVRAADGTITGTFGLEIVFGENLKPCNKNGLTNPYVVIKLPEGTKPLPDESATPDGVPKPVNLELAKSSVIHDSVNPTWDESFQISVLPTKTIEIYVYNKTSFLTSDEVCGKKVVRLSSGWCDHQTHDIWIKLEPQGRLLIRITMDGEGEDLSFFFKNAKQRLMRALIDFLRALVHRISPYVREVLTKACKDNEAAPSPAKSIFSLTKALSNVTASGKSIDTNLTPQEAEEALLPLTEYLDKNLETLCSSLSSKMAQEVIFRTWCDILVVLENLMVPQMYGAVERERKILNKRQINFIQTALDILFDFFHAEGEGLGLPKSTLRKAPKYRDISILITNYNKTVDELKEEYEITKKPHILKLIRLYSQVGEDSQLRESARVFLEKELEKLNNKDSDNSEKK